MLIQTACINRCVEDALQRPRREPFASILRMDGLCDLSPASRVSANVIFGNRPVQHRGKASHVGVDAGRIHGANRGVRLRCQCSIADREDAELLNEIDGQSSQRFEQVATILTEDIRDESCRAEHFPHLPARALVRAHRRS